MAKFTALEAVAAHGSISYGPLTAERLKAILLGDEPTRPESARVYQGLTETPTFVLEEVARQIGISYPQIELRFSELFQKELEKAQHWKIVDV